MSEEEVDPLEVLREDLEDDDITVQLDAVRNLPTIALAMGQELARTKLLQFLESYCFPVDRQNDFRRKDNSLGVKEEVLREVAQVLDGSMLLLLGGKDSALAVLLLLQKLAMVEETVIRDAAVAGIISCVTELDGLFVDQHVLPLITALAEEAWWTSRVSAAAAGPRLYPYLQSHKCMSDCSDMILKLCRDEMPMVRQEAYVSIPYMLKAMGDNNLNELREFIVPVLKILAKELQENMRHQIVDVVKALLKLNKPELIDVCREHISFAISDANWRVRKRFLDQLMEITEVAPEAFVGAEILEGFVRRLKDTEPSVRVKAIKLIPEFFSHKNCNAIKVRELITEEVISALVKDEYPEVREATSGSILHIFEKLEDPDKGLPASTKEEIVDIMIQFQTDDSGEVRLNFCKGLMMAHRLCGEELFVNRLLSPVLKLQEDSKWRVRSGVLQNMELFVRLCQANKIPEQAFHKMLLEALKDPVADARNQCISKISGIIPVMGSKWVQDRVFSVVVKEFYDQQNKYLYRIVPIRIAERLAIDLVDEKQSGTDLRLKAVEMMCRGCKDHISNVRLASADSLINFLRANNTAQYGNKIRTSMELLSRDADEDVKYLSVVALGMLKA